MAGGSGRGYDVSSVKLSARVFVEAETGMKAGLGSREMVHPVKMLVVKAWHFEFNL